MDLDRFGRRQLAPLALGLLIALAWLLCRAVRP